MDLLNEALKIMANRMEAWNLYDACIRMLKRDGISDAEDYIVRPDEDEDFEEME